ncbi:MAG TPA: glycosyltransferase family 8 protein [Devosiaceae bacterium]|jgi:lipopolysaccharide biosynthesis glycosyltransferase
MPPIHIALTFDDSYWAPAYATMRSICLTTRRRGDLVFHLCHRTLTGDHKDDLDSITTEFGAAVRYYNIDEMPLFNEVAGRAPYNYRLSNIVYARLLFADILPADIERITYLDCDMMVRAPIEQVAEVDLGPYPIAAVPDAEGMNISLGRDIKTKRDLFDPADPYFNAGLIVIDMRKWREAQIIPKLEKAMADGTMARLYYDQDFLNLVFNRNWLQLEQMWNLVDPRPVHQTLHPKLVHYTGDGKPWTLTNVAFRRTYRHVMSNRVYSKYRKYRWGRAWGGPFRKIVALYRVIKST